MENLSIKNILWVLLGIGAGFFGGAILGTLIGVIVWAVPALALGSFVYHFPNSLMINTLLSVLLSLLLILPIVAIVNKTTGSNLSCLRWGIAAIVIGLIVVLTYGTNIIAHPETYANYNHIVLNPRMTLTDPKGKLEKTSRNAELYFGGGTGQLIGSSLYALIGGLVVFRETIGKKRKVEDKQEFDRYSKFLNNYKK